jgi:hypothetical protein
MHIQTSHSARAGHRHFLAAPVFVLALGLSMLSGSERMSAAASVVDYAGELRAAGNDSEFALPRGVYGLLQEDGVLREEFDALRLADGTAYVASEGRVRLRAQEWLLQSFHGGMLVSTAPDAVSVLALTSPVLVRHGEFRLVIPAGMQGQWHGDALSEFSLRTAAAERVRLRAIPPSILRDALQTLSRLEPVALPQAPEQSAAERQLREALESHDTASALALLADDAAYGLSTEALVPLLLSAHAIPSAAQQILDEVRDGDLWLLLSFHGAFASVAWETPGPLGLPLAMRELRWLLLPGGDIGAPLPARVIDRWKDQVQKHVDTSEHPEEFLAALLASLADYRSLMSEQEFPERLGRLSRALEAIVEPHLSALSDDDKALYASWKDIHAIAPYTEAPAVVVPKEPQYSSSSSAIAAPPEVFDAASLEAQARGLLQNAGALFTIQTELRAESSSRVRVAGIVFASPQGEHRYDFTLNVADTQITNLQQDGTLLPYALTLEASGQWAITH